MTLASRKRTLIGMLILIIAIDTAIAMLFLRDPPTLSVSQLFSVVAASLAVVPGVLAGALFIRLFRRNTSVSVFFVTLSFLLIGVDGLKLLQLVALSQAFPRIAVIISRLLIGANLLWVSALAAAGLYAGGVRMQRHGTAMLSMAALVGVLAAAIPLDTGTIPNNLVFDTVLPASLDGIVAMFATMAVLNYVYAAVNDRSSRRLIAALAIALIAFGREGLYHWIEPLPVLVSLVALIAGTVTFALQHYREQILG